MTPFDEHLKHLSRRSFLGVAGAGVGQAALGTLLGGAARAGASTGGASGARAADAGLAELPHFRPQAKRLLCLFQSEGFSHVDLFDYKPTLTKHHGQEIPPSVKGNQRLTGMTSGQGAYPVVAPLWPGRPCGDHGTWISDQLPHMQPRADDICIVKSMYTEAINHDPAITFINTGNQQPGYASMGAWVSYGLGSQNENLPTFVAMVSQGSGKNPGQPIFARLWGNGFLPSCHQGVGLRPGASPVLYLEDPAGVSREQRRAELDDLAKLNELRAAELGDPETLARVHAYEMAFRMQTSVPELTDLSDEPANVIAS